MKHFRRKPNPAAVRETLKVVPPVNERVIHAYGEEIVRLRGEIERAARLLREHKVDAAITLLDDALYERP